MVCSNEAYNLQERQSNNYGDTCKITIMINTRKQTYMGLWKDHGNSRHWVVGSHSLLAGLMKTNNEEDDTENCSRESFPEEVVFDLRSEAWRSI